MTAGSSLRPSVREKGSRREFFKRAGSTLAGLLAGLPVGWPGHVYADDSPETKNVRFGIMPLTDCAPVVMAHELGYFKKFGIESVVSTEPSWTVIRDKLIQGHNQASQMLFGMALASTVGLSGSRFTPIVIPWIMNRNGQGITLSNTLRQTGVKTAGDLKPLVDRARAAGRRMTFAMTFPQGTHAMWLRYWLGSGGIHPDQDVKLITTPPPSMVENMRVGKVDGYCVGEPWNARAITDGVGYTVVTSQQIWRDHPENVCAFTEEFATRNPKTVKAILKALHLSSVFLDRLDNRREAAEMLSRRMYVNCPPDVILERLLGRYDYGDGRRQHERYYMIFSERGCTYPQKAFGTWWLSQFRRWGMIKTPPPYEAIVNRSVRSDLYLETMKDLGVRTKVVEVRKFALFDGVPFDAANPEQYARAFPIRNIP